MNYRLTQIEKRLQAFVESTINPFPSARISQLARRLVEAVESSLIQRSDGGLAAAPAYTIALHPTDFSIWQIHPEWLYQLVQVLGQAAWDEGLAFETQLRLSLVADLNVQTGAVKVFPSTAPPALGQTGIMSLHAEHPKENVDPRPRNAFLILENGRIFSLQLVTINIGRRLENQLIIDDPRVSRSHAQLRAARQSYTIFDLNSTGGTFVNNLPISQHTLRPGDVISLAGVVLIYGEEAAEEPRPTSEDTSTYSTLSNDFDKPGKF
jgi:hypothetical protein